MRARRDGQASLRTPTYCRMPIAAVYTAITSASTTAVAVGTTLSAFWILSANSWMQMPAGHEVRNGIAFPVDWLKIIFSPTFPTRLGHMVVAAYITTAFVVFAVGARWLLQDKDALSVRMFPGSGGEEQISR